jgi:hypothetical protein
MVPNLLTADMVWPKLPAFVASASAVRAAAQRRCYYYCCAEAAAVAVAHLGASWTAASAPLAAHPDVAAGPPQSVARSSRPRPGARSACCAGTPVAADVIIIGARSSELSTHQITHPSGSSTRATSRCMAHGPTTRLPRARSRSRAGCVCVCVCVCVRACACACACRSTHRLDASGLHGALLVLAPAHGHVEGLALIQRGLAQVRKLQPATARPPIQ